MARDGGSDFIRVVAAYFLPPLGVFLQSGLGAAFWINLLLTFFGYLPGVLHAVWVIAATDADGRVRETGSQDTLALLLAYFLPPLGVALRRGIGVPLVVNLVLTIACLWVGGQLHAAWVICQPDDA